MARTRRVKSMAEGTAHYHLISRASNRQFLFREARTKDKLAELFRRTAEFSGVRREAFAMMDNHIHVLCTVVRTDEKVPEDEVLRRVGVLKGEKAADMLAQRWATSVTDREVLRSRRLASARRCASSACRRVLFSIWRKRSSARRRETPRCPAMSATLMRSHPCILMYAFARRMSAAAGRTGFVEARSITQTGGM